MSSERLTHQENFQPMTVEDIGYALQNDYGLLVSVAAQYDTRPVYAPDDLVQAAAMRLVAKLTNPDPDISFVRKDDERSSTRYLATTVGNCAKDVLRTKTYRTQTSLDGLMEVDDQVLEVTHVVANSEDTIDSLDVAEKVLKYLESVNADFADAIRCTVVNDELAMDYAKRLGIPPLTVRTRLHRAKKILRKAWENGEIKLEIMPASFGGE